MSKIIERKWKLASGIGFAVALACDLIDKLIAGERMSSMARRAAGLPTVEPGWLTTCFSGEVIVPIGLLFAVLAAFCWDVSAYRSEPGSSFAIAVLAILYAGFFFILV